ncbi:MAG: serine hydrolase domain-containing protein [Pseudomonadota bacterium]
MAARALPQRLQQTSKTLACLIAISTSSAACQLAETATEVETNLSTDEAVYLQRYEALAARRVAGVGLAGYDPLETVAGAEPTQDLPRTDAAARTLAPATWKTIEAYAGERNSSALIVWRRGAIEYERYYGDTTRESLLVSRSLAKPLATIAIGRALQLGHIDNLSQPVADFITEWQGTPKAAIELRHLLQMRSGLLPQGRASGPDDVLNRAYLHPRHGEVIINEYPLVDPPGSRYEYANANTELVAVIIERATGVRYGDWLTQQVLIPLGAAGGEIWVNRPGGLGHAGCCILLPAETYLRLGILLLNNGRYGNHQLLDEAFVQAMKTPAPQNPHAGMGLYVAGEYVAARGAANPDRGVGLTQHSEPYRAADLFLFDGNGHQVLYMVPSDDLIVMRLGARPPAELPWDNSLLPNRVIEGIARAPGEEAPIPQAP